MDLGKQVNVVADILGIIGYKQMSADLKKSNDISMMKTYLNLIYIQAPEEMRVEFEDQLATVGLSYN